MNHKNNKQTEIKHNSIILALKSTTIYTEKKVEYLFK